MRLPRRSILSTLFIILLGCAAAFAASDNGTAEPTVIQSVSAFVDTDPKVSDEEMQTLLNWALENSDPGKLKELAADVESGARPDLEDIDYVLKRRKELKETMEYMEKANPSESVLIKEAIAVANRTTGIKVDPSLAAEVANISLNDVKMLRKALEQLATLVEPIDNANDFPKMGGLAPVFRTLASKAVPQAVHCAALDILRVASSNNPTFVQALVTAQPDTLALLAVLSRGEGAPKRRKAKDDNCDVPVKALTALSNVLRAEPGVREAFLSTEAGGLTFLEHMFTKTALDRYHPEERGRNLKLELRLLHLVQDLYESGAMAAAPAKHAKMIGTMALQRLIDQCHTSEAQRSGSVWEVTEPDVLESSLMLARAVMRAETALRPDTAVVSVASRAVLGDALKELSKAAKEDETWTELLNLSLEVHKVLAEYADVRETRDEL